MTATEAFEALATRGTPRGAAAVLRAARTPAEATVPLRRRWPIWVPITAIAAVLVFVAVVSWQARNEDSQPVDSGPGPGYLFGEPTDTTLIINSGFGDLVALDLDTGLAQRYSNLDVRPREIFLQSIDLIDDHVVYQGDDGPIAMPLDLEGEPRLVGRAYYYRASGNPDRLWLIGRDDTVSEVTVDGETTLAPVELPRYGDDRAVSPNVGVGAGLGVGTGALEGDDLQGSHYWDPATNDLVDLADQDIMAARGSTLVTGWASSIVVVPEGISRDIDPDLFIPEVVSISPDERTVAAWARGDSDAGEPDGLVLIDAGTGQWRAVPGGSGFRADGMAWSEDGSWLFALGDGAVLAYRVGAQTARVVHTSSMIGGGPLAVARTKGPLLDAVSPVVCPERVDAVPSPDATIVQVAPDGGPPMPTVDVDVPITEGQPCLVRRGD